MAIMNNYYEVHTLNQRTNTPVVLSYAREDYAMAHNAYFASVELACPTSISAYDPSWGELRCIAEYTP